MAAVRLAVKAIIIHNRRVLLLKNRDEQGDWYMLPGGGQEHGETIPNALRRECLEEIAADVSVGRLRFIREYIGKHHEFAAEDGHMHQVELMFACEVMSEPRLGSKPDLMQTGIEWIELNSLAQVRIYPRILQQLLASDNSANEPVYLGDVN